MKTILIPLIAAALAIAAEKAPKTPDPTPAAPVLTAVQKLKLRDAQVLAISAEKKFSDYMQTIQRQLDSLPEYQSAKKNLETTTKAWQAAIIEAREVVKCPDCDLNPETLALTRPVPKQAKVETEKPKQ